MGKSRTLNGQGTAALRAALASVEDEVNSGAIAQANIRLNTQPTLSDTITIGADIYEFVNTLGAGTPGHIGVLRGVSAAAALTNIIEAINGLGVVNGVGVHADGNGTNALKASIYNVDFLHIEAADAVGGNPVAGAGPSLALSDGLTAVIAWDHTNLSKTGSSGELKKQIIKVVVDATNLAADFELIVPFTPVKASVFLVTDASDVPDATGKSALLTLVQARKAVKVDLNGDTTDPVATDIVYLEVWGK